MGRRDQRLNPTHKPRLLSKEPVATPPAAPLPANNSKHPANKNEHTDQHQYIPWYGGTSADYRLRLRAALGHVTRHDPLPVGDVDHHAALLNGGRGGGLARQVGRWACRLWRRHVVWGMTKAGPLGPASVWCAGARWLSAAGWHE